MNCLSRLKKHMLDCGPINCVVFSVSFGVSWSSIVNTYIFHKRLFNLYDLLHSLCLLFGASQITCFCLYRPCNGGGPKHVR